MEEFYNIFGPELKAVTGDPKRIEDVLKRVDALIVPIESVSRLTTRALRFAIPPQQPSIDAQQGLMQKLFKNQENQFCKF